MGADEKPAVIVTEEFLYVRSGCSPAASKSSSFASSTVMCLGADLPVYSTWSLLGFLDVCV